MLPGHSRVGVGRDDGRSGRRALRDLLRRRPVPRAGRRHVLAGGTGRRAAVRTTCWDPSGSAPGSGSATGGAAVRSASTTSTSTSPSRPAQDAVRLILARIARGDPAGAGAGHRRFQCRRRMRPAAGSSTSRARPRARSLAGVSPGISDLPVLRDPPRAASMRSWSIEAGESSRIACST